MRFDTSRPRDDEAVFREEVSRDGSWMNRTGGKARRAGERPDGSAAAPSSTRVANADGFGANAERTELKRGDLRRTRARGSTRVRRAALRTRKAPVSGGSTCAGEAKLRRAGCRRQRRSRAQAPALPRNRPHGGRPRGGERKCDKGDLLIHKQTGTTLAVRREHSQAKPMRWLSTEASSEEDNFEKSRVSTASRKSRINARSPPA